MTAPNTYTILIAAGAGLLVSGVITILQRREDPGNTGVTIAVTVARAVAGAAAAALLASVEHAAVRWTIGILAIAGIGFLVARHTSGRLTLRALGTVAVTATVGLVVGFVAGMLSPVAADADTPLPATAFETTALGDGGTLSIGIPTNGEVELDVTTARGPIWLFEESSAARPIRFDIGGDGSIRVEAAEDGPDIGALAADWSEGHLRIRPGAGEGWAVVSEDGRTPTSGYLGVEGVRIPGPAGDLGERLQADWADVDPAVRSATAEWLDLAPMQVAGLASRPPEPKIFHAELRLDADGVVDLCAEECLPLFDPARAIAGAVDGDTTVLILSDRRTPDGLARCHLVDGSASGAFTGEVCVDGHSRIVYVDDRTAGIVWTWDGTP